MTCLPDQYRDYSTGMMGMARQPDWKQKIADIDIIGSIATVRLEIDNWTGHKFTDLFTLLKVDGEWKIMNKVFYLHA